MLITICKHSSAIVTFSGFPCVFPSNPPTPSQIFNSHPVNSPKKSHPGIRTTPPPASGAMPSHSISPICPISPIQPHQSRRAVGGSRSASAAMPSERSEQCLGEARLWEAPHSQCRRYWLCGVAIQKTIACRRYAIMVAPKSHHQTSHPPHTSPLTKHLTRSTHLTPHHTFSKSHNHSPPQKVAAKPPLNAIFY